MNIENTNSVRIFYNVHVLKNRIIIIWRIAKHVLADYRVFTKYDDTKMVMVIKVQPFVVSIMHVRHPYFLHYGRKVIDSVWFVFTTHHFLEAGHIRIVCCDNIQHFTFYAWLGFMFQNLKMFHIPTHNTKVSGFFFQCKFFV